MKKIFGGAGAAQSGDTGASVLHGTESVVDSGKSSSAPRRELVQVVLRDTMRKHGVPSDWIDCRILSAMTRQHRSGMHVQFLVRKSDDQLLNYVHAFQESFWEELKKFDPRAADWLFSVAWQFDGKATRGFGPDANLWANEPDTQPPEEDPGDLETDLQALYAIRDAALTSSPATLGGPGKS